MIIGVKINDCEKGNKFMNDTHERLTKIGNPFTKGFVLKFKTFYVIRLDILFMKFHYIGFMLLGGALYLKGLVFGWWLIPIILLCLPVFGWSKVYNGLLIRKGLRKAGYKGEIKLFYWDKLTEMVVEDVRMGSI